MILSLNESKNTLPNRIRASYLELLSEPKTFLLIINMCYINRQQSFGDSSATLEVLPSFKEPESFLATDDSLDGFGDLESVLNSFSIDTRKPKPYKRRKSLAMSMKFWKSKDDQH